MSRQKIIVVNLAHAFIPPFLEFETVKDLNDWIRGVEEVIDVREDLKVFVGEERCIEIHEGRASNQYKITLAGCNCGKRPIHRPLEWDIRHGVTDGFN